MPHVVQQIGATHCKSCCQKVFPWHTNLQEAWKFPCLQVLWFGSTHSATYYEGLNRHTTEQTQTKGHEFKSSSLAWIISRSTAWRSTVKIMESTKPQRSPDHLTWVCQWFRVHYCLLLCRALLSKFGVHFDPGAARFCSSWNGSRT